MATAAPTPTEFSPVVDQALAAEVLITEFDQWISELHDGAQLLDRDSVIDRVLDLRNAARPIRDAFTAAAADSSAPPLC